MRYHYTQATLLLLAVSAAAGPLQLRTSDPQLGARDTRDATITPDTLAEQSETSVPQKRETWDAISTPDAPLPQPEANSLQKRRRWDIMNKTVATLILGLDYIRSRLGYAVNSINREDLNRFMNEVYIEYGTHYTGDEWSDAERDYFRHQNSNARFPAQDEVEQAKGVFYKKREEENNKPVEGKM